VLLRSPFEAGAGHDSITYSPKGRWLQVVADDQTKTFDLAGLKEIRTFQAWPESFSANEALGLSITVGSVSIARLSDGKTKVFPESPCTFCARDGKLYPPSTCPSPN